MHDPYLQGIYDVQTVDATNEIILNLKDQGEVENSSRLVLSCLSDIGMVYQTLNL